MLTPSIPLEPSTAEPNAGEPSSIEASAPAGQRDLCLRQLFESLETPLLRYAFSMLRRREVAEEIVQEVFMKLHVHWQTVENPQAWLYRSVRNGVLGYLRKNKAELPPGSAAQRLLEQLASDGTTATGSFTQSRPSNHEHRSNHSAHGDKAEGQETERGTASGERHQGNETMSHPSVARDAAAKSSASRTSSPVAVLAMASLQPQQCPQAISQRIEACELLREAIDQLEAKDQEIVRLKYFEGMKYREISERTGLSIGNVGYRLHNILTSLANRLRPLGIDGA